ncbi:MAG: HEPN domain-containing protein [Lentisphaerae bacterium]|nr:HEPN domain-containing protein [Lentisphaerota bacterium]
MTEDNCRANAIDESRRGDECLAEAKYLLEGGFWNAAVSRAYYAAFHWALALLMMRGLEPKTHRGVIQLLQLHYVETGDLSSASAAALGQLETYRELSDYNAKANFDDKRAAAEIQRAETFIASCRPLIS